jgi:hydroxylamine dehydrogenase
VRIACLLFALVACAEPEPVVIKTALQGADPESCLGCHEMRQPGLIAQWNASAHAREAVNCEDCHGDDHDAIFSAEGRVGVDRCKECHTKETMAFKRSSHARARSDALRNARLLMQIPSMQRQGCLGCHNMAPGAKSSAEGGEGGEGDAGRCNDCHGAHAYSAKQARSPEACGVCHRGPDHPHIEAFFASKHGVAWAATHDEEMAPTCVTCHMPDGEHEVSGGITFGRSGSGAVVEGSEMPIPMHTMTTAQIRDERAVMLARCAKCHTERTARRALEDADAIKFEADRLLQQAADIVEGLHADGLLDPMPRDRVAHPTKGHTLVLGGPMLYEQQSEAERIFFDLAKFAHAITFKGAYHLSPDHTHWLGIARLKASIEELRAEDRRLRKD